ncbi:hypothetical protein CBI36_07940 [Acetobacter oryzifermentans]|nr:hypothetical protein CBI36_07940 [Acetobacter oryzifermentans]
MKGMQMEFDYLTTIKEYWNGASDYYGETHPEHHDASRHPSWGLWHIPESEIRLLGAAIRPGVNLLEIGCGNGHDAVGFARLGANVMALDLSERQIARGIPHPSVNYVCSKAESVPADDGTFDIVTCDHGSLDHSPARLILPEVSRVLKPGGVGVFCVYSPLAMMCFDIESKKLGNRLLSPLPRAELHYNGEVTSSYMSHGDWIRELIDSGFVIERLEELRPCTASTEYFGELVDLEWARKWPCDMAWVVRKRD